MDQVDMGLVGGVLAAVILSPRYSNEWVCFGGNNMLEPNGCTGPGLARPA